jgi:hypothetical protein
MEVAVTRRQILEGRNLQQWTGFLTADWVLADTENKVLGHPGTRLEASLPPQQPFYRMAGSSIQ